MTNLGIRKPTNAIVAGGTPLKTEQKIETATNMYPGRLVIKGTNDDDIIVGTAAGPVIGWLGYEQANANYMPDDVDTIYVVNALAPVLFGGNFLIVGRLANGQNVTKGARLVAAANGELTVATAAAATSGSATASAVDATTPTIAGCVGAQGICVAIAWESVNASGGASDIVVKSMI